MKNEIIKKFLDMHYIEYQETEAGTIYAIEKGTYWQDGQRRTYEEPVNVTGWSKNELYAWLGY